MNTKTQVLVDEPDAAAMAGVSLATLKRHRRGGTGPDYVMVGRRIKYRPSAIEAWIDANTIKSH